MIDGRREEGWIGNGEDEVLMLLRGARSGMASYGVELRRRFE